MPTLHTLNKSPMDHSLREELLNACTTGDALLLIEDGAYYSTNEALLHSPTLAHVYALTPDLEARGLKVSPQSAIKMVEYEEFVDLSLEFDKVISWY